MPRFRLYAALLAPAIFSGRAFADAPQAILTVHADQVLHAISPYLAGACIEDVNHEIYGGIYSQMLFGEGFQEPPLTQPVKRTAIPFEAAKSGGLAVSGMWRWLARGTVQGQAAIETDKPFLGSQSQRLTLTSGDGAIGIENQGLNRQGIGVVQGKPYEGYIWARADAATPLIVALQNRDTGRIYAEATLQVTSADWQRLDFALTPDTQDAAARFVIELRQRGAVVLGHAFLQPGEWGRFKGLPVRGDVVQGLIDQGIKVLRYGGSMVNTDEYRWKKMIGPRDRRPPYRGHWYPYSTNGWGIIDFLNLCEAAGIHGIPAFNINETPADMADFIEYANGSADSPWGKKRAVDGHPAPYGITQIELGNEERVDDVYVGKFTALAAAIWPKDSTIIPVVGDFAYDQSTTDPMHVSRAASGITSLAGQQKILELARQNHREVWFDVHIDTNGPGISRSMDALPTYVDAIDALANGAAHKVVVFELNSGNPALRRALANAHAILSIERDGRLPVCTSANGLQVDGQNDNGWNQGLLFFNTSKVWLQPPGYVSQMISTSAQPLLVTSVVENANPGFEVNAQKSDDGKQLVLEVLNNGDAEQAIAIRLDGFTPVQGVATVRTLAGPLKSQNTADAPDQITPVSTEWQHHLKDGAAAYTFPARSFSIVCVR